MITAKEAVESIKKQRDEAGIAFLGWVNLTVEHYNAVVDALEKKIPKKPLPYKGFDGKCVCCGVVFLDRSTKYCGNCGQALDWSD